MAASASGVSTAESKPAGGPIAQAAASVAAQKAAAATPAPSKDAKTDSAPGEKKPDSKQAKAPVVTPAAAPAPDPLAEVEKRLAAVFGPDAFKPQTAPDDKLLEGLPEGAQERVRYLANERRQAVEQLGQMQEQVGQWQGWANQVNERFNQQQQMLVRLQTENEYLKQGAIRQEDPDDPRVAYARTKEEILTEGEKRFLEKHIAPLRQELDTYKQGQKEADTKKQNAEISQRYIQESRTAARDVLLRGFPAELAAKLEGPLSGLVNSAAYGRNSDMQSGAIYMRNILADYVRGLMSATMPAATDAIKDGQAVPPVVAQGRGQSGASGKGFMTNEDAVKAGYKNSLDAMIKQSQGR